MKNKSILTLVFAVLSVFFFLVLIFFRTPFTLYPLDQQPGCPGFADPAGVDSHLLAHVQANIQRRFRLVGRDHLYAPGSLLGFRAGYAPGG